MGFVIGTVVICVMCILTFDLHTVYGNEYLMSHGEDGRYKAIIAFAGSTSGWVHLPSSTQWIRPYSSESIPVRKPLTTETESKSPGVITSGDNIMVYESYKFIMFPLLPISALGPKYIVSSCHPAGEYTSVLEIATHRHQTAVDITFRLSGSVTSDGTTYTNGDTLSLNLLEYQTFTIKSDYDLSGTVIDAAQTVAVFSGTMYGTMVAAYEQLLPVKHFGQEYVVAVDDNPALYKLQVVSEQSDTKIMFNNGSTVSVGVSGIHSQTLTQNASFVFTTTRPVMTILCRESSGLQIGFAVVPPVQLYVNQTAYGLSYTSKVLADRDTDFVVLSAADIPGKWDDIPASRYKVGTWTLSSSLTSITATTSFTVLTFTSQDICSGGYNFAGSSEITCDGEYYGQGCSRVCSARHCEGGSTCASPMGQCDGGCQSGWTGIDCKICDSGYYGPDCSKSCGTRHCEGDSSCDRITGQCDGDCQTGWAGTDCTVLLALQATHPNLTVVVAVTVTCVVVFLFAFGSVGVLVWRRRSRRSREDVPEQIRYDNTNRSTIQPASNGHKVMNSQIVSVEDSSNQESEYAEIDCFEDRAKQENYEEVQNTNAYITLYDSAHTYEELTSEGQNGQNWYEDLNRQGQ